MKVACFSLSGEQLTLNNVAIPNGWRFFEHMDVRGIAEYEPDVVYVGGWFASNYIDWQIYKSMIGRCPKVIVQWFGSDVLSCKGFYDQGQREMFRQLSSDRYVNIPPTDIIKGEIETWLELETTEPLNVPAEEVFRPEDWAGRPKPTKPQVAVYMPAGRQDFFRLPLIKQVVDKMPDVRFLFYHWIPEILKVEVRTGPNPTDKWSPDPSDMLYGTTREDYHNVLGDSTCSLRIPIHDAHSITGAEFLMSGKPLISDRDMPRYPRQVRGKDITVDAVVRAIRRAIEHPEVDAAVSDYYRDRWDPSKYAERVAERCRTKWEGFEFGTERVGAGSPEAEEAEVMG